VEEMTIFTAGLEGFWTQQLQFFLAEQEKNA
jgi:hypothetical protein